MWPSCETIKPVVGPLESKVLPTRSKPPTVRICTTESATSFAARAQGLLLKLCEIGLLGTNP